MGAVDKLPKLVMHPFQKGKAESRFSAKEFGRVGCKAIRRPETRRARGRFSSN